MVATIEDATQKRATFFKYVFGEDAGWLRLARLHPETRVFEERFFEIPGKMIHALNWVADNQISNNIYFSPMLFSEPKGIKAFVLPVRQLWADLDECPPEKCFVEPSFALETSPGRYQALWTLDEHMDPADAETITKKIAYAHANEGADRSGWDLTQLLRIPLTINHKYGVSGVPGPLIKIIKARRDQYNVTDFDVYPEIPGDEVQMYLFLKSYRIRMLTPFFKRNVSDYCLRSTSSLKSYLRKIGASPFGSC